MPPRENSCRGAMQEFAESSPSINNIYQLVSHRAQNLPTAFAILAPGRQPLTYQSLKLEMEYVRETLRSFGVGKQDRVVSVLPHGPEAAVACLSVASCAVFAPLNPAYRESEFQFYLKDLEAKVLMVPQGPQGSGSAAVTVAEKMGLSIVEVTTQNKGCTGQLHLSCQQPLPQADLIESDGPEELALILYTSGTSSRPKQVGLTHRNICASARNIAAAVELTEQDRSISVMPLFHIHGLSVIYASMATGGSVVCPEAFSADFFFDHLRTFRPSWYTAAPAIHYAIYDLIRSHPGLVSNNSLRFIRSASAPAKKQLMANLENVLHAPFIEAYGMTEAGPQIASNRLPPFERKEGSVGKPMGPEVAIVNELGERVAPFEQGEIVVRGANVARFVSDDVESPAGTVEGGREGGWYRSGDAGYLDDDGYLFVTGRLKEIINRGGEKISPREVDQYLETHPAVEEAATFGAPHPKLGEHVAAAVVLKESTQQVSSGLVKDIQRFLSQQLAPFKIPQQILFVDAIPKTATGKLMRSQLLELYNDNASALRIDQRPKDSIGAEGAIAAKLSEIWAAVMHISRPGRHANFFHLGGHSLSATQVILRIEKEFQIQLPVDCIFKHPTIHQLSIVLGEEMVRLVLEGHFQRVPKDSATPNGASSLGAIQRRNDSGPFPLSFSQQRLWFLNKMETGRAYHMSASLYLSGALDIKILEESINKMRQRHDSLRTLFRIIEDDPAQYVVPYEEHPLPLVDLPVPARSRTVDDSELVQLATDDANRPFDLSQGPLFRTELVRLETNAHVLLMSMHHIISDGWSVGILFKELAKTYEALANKRPVVLPELSIRFADYVAWQRQQLEGVGLQHDILYWKQKLKDLAPLNTFPSDKPRPVTQTFNSEKLELTISKTCLDSIRALCESEGVTLFMTCLAAFHAVQFGFTGNRDCVVGIPIAHRNRIETEGLIGFFANTLVLRNDLSGDPSFKELLSRVQKTAFEAFEHQSMPFEKLMDELQPSRTPSHTPLFQVMFAYQNFTDPQQPLLGSDFKFTSELSATPLASDRSSSKFDLTVYLSESDQGLQTSWHYNTDLYHRSTIERFAMGFSEVLKAVTSDLEWTASAQALHPFSRSGNVEPLGVRLEETISTFEPFTQLFETQAQETPDFVALVCGEEQLTYQWLNERANQTARHFQALGMTRNTLLGIYLPRSVDHLAAILAIWKLGGAYLSLDPAYPASRLTFMLEDVELEFLVSDDSLLTDFDGGNRQPTILSLNGEQAAIVQQDTSDLCLPITAEDLAYVIYTSGSTSKPKGAMIAHSNVAHYTNALRENLEIGPGDRYLHTASFSFSSSVRQFTMPLSSGARLCLADNDQLSDPGLLFQWVAQQKVSVIDLIPSYWRASIQVLKEMDETTRLDLLDNHLRLCLSASEPLPSFIPETWMFQFGHPARFVNMYGQTETSGIVSVFPIPSTDRGSEEIVPIGSPIKTSKIYLLNEFKKEVPEGTPGEVYVGGAGVCLGYRRDADLTKDRFVSDPFSTQASDRLYRTGDLARYRSDGTLEILGRVDEQIKVRGFRIEPAEIEAAIRRCPGVREAVVLAVASDCDNEGGKRLVAFVVPTASKAKFTTEGLRHILKQELPVYMVPSFIHVLDVLPQTPNGKVDKKELTMILKPLSVMSDNGPVENTDTLTMVERELLAIWKEVIGLKELGIDENYFEVGGDSLLSIRIVNRGKRAGLFFSLKQLFQFQTVRDLASVVSLVPTEPLAEPAKGDVESSSKPSSVITDESIVVSLESLRAYGHEALIKSGLDPQGAKIVTEVQLEASLRGQKTHHVVSIPRYARRIAQGVLNPRPNIRILKETPVSALIDGDNGPGQWVAYESMKTAISKAKESGIGIVSTLHSNHLGATGHYAWMATCEGLIGMCTTNGPVVLAPTGGVTPTFGNNPLGVGFPVQGDEPILVDFSMSVAPRSKIGLQVAEGKALPLGWILDKFGRHTTQLDDLASGLGVPIGEHKGYGLAMVMEVLSGVLSGAGFCLDHSKPAMKQAGKKADFGHFFMAFDPALFVPLEEFESRVEEMVSQTKQGETALGVDEILIPGEAELKARSRNLEKGVPLTEAVLRTLEDYAQEVGLSTELVFLSDKRNI